MNNKGAVLVFSLVIILVLSVLASSFYFKSINENTLTKRYVESIRAFWLAEAGRLASISLGFTSRRLTASKRKSPANMPWWLPAKSAFKWRPTTGAGRSSLIRF